MKYVLDANIATAWVLPYPHSSNALRFRDDYRHQAHELISPSTFLGEVASALTKAERQRIIKPGEARRLLSIVLGDAPILIPYESFAFEATDISSRTRSSFSACLLLTLAKHERCELMTGDERFVRNVQQQYPFVRSISTY
jgi:predicted nucleic acid-binding protein